MSCRLFAGVLLLGAVDIVAQTSPEPPVAEAYGPGDQAVHIGASAFRPDDTLSAYFTDPTDGYLYRISGQTFYWMSAPLILPTGSEIFGMCLYAVDSNLGIETVAARLDAVRLAPGGVAPGIFPVGPVVSTSFDIGYGVVCSEPFSYTYHDTGEMDGDGNLEHLAHRVRVRIQVTDETGALGGVRVFWRRQVSPAPGEATFNDVPTSHGFFQYVEALATSGITAGCGSGNYCPDAPLTRGQMAVFLAKALGLHWPY